MRFPKFNISSRSLASETSGDAKSTKESNNGFEIVDDKESLPIRSKDQDPIVQDDDVTLHGDHNRPESSSELVQIHPVPSESAVIIKIQPPREPEVKLDHVPCDMVLVIDVSGSMGDAAPVPGDGEEATGMSILDLVKHATNAIINTCNETDRIGIVKFASNASLVQPLTPMSEVNKKTALEKVANLKPTSATNLWGGMVKALEVFEKQPSNNVQAMMVLTDGMPNCMCPQQGYVPKLSDYSPLKPTIHTFGFGYELRSGLLKSIAEAGGGNYGFIPDAGMIATVFNHAVANLQSTYATNATLRLTYDNTFELEQTMGDHVGQMEPVVSSRDPTQLQIKLDNLQFGQSRDIYLKVKKAPGKTIEEDVPNISALLSYQPTLTTDKPDSGPEIYSASADILAAGGLSEAEVAFHASRSQVSSFLLSMFEMNAEFERQAGLLGTRQETVKKLQSLIKDLPAARYKDVSEDNRCIMEDLCGKDPRGQVALAISTDEFFERWGEHYLLSYVNAHTRQIANSFKDLGPQRYGADSPLFKKCLAHLDKEFDRLEPPAPSRTVIDRQTGKRTFLSSSAVSISRYNNSMGPCFAGSTNVDMASGRKLPIKKLRRGMKVVTPLGPRKVAMLLKTPVQEALLCQVGNIMVTPWHPISLNGGKTWTFPANVADRPIRYTGAVYSVLLLRDVRSEAHAISLSGAWGVTLGHGILASEEGDVRAHEFFGDWMRVGKGLVGMGVSRGGVVVGGGVVRDEETGRVVAFKARSG